jgi:hypothetical protein
MPTAYKIGKKKTTAKKKKPNKKPAKKGSKSGSKSGGGGDSLGPQDPIVISGGGSVKMKIKLGQFQNHGGGNWKNALANLSSLSIDGGPPLPLSTNSVITIKLA